MGSAVAFVLGNHDTRMTWAVQRCLMEHAEHILCSTSIIL